MSTQPLERAIESTRGVLGNVDASDLDGPTPCASWDVRGLVNHIVGGMQFFHRSLSGDPAPDGDQDVTGTDFVAAYTEAGKQTVAGFQAEGALERTMTLPFGEMPGAAFMGLATLDTFQHGWDLAKATGQPTDLDPELAAQLLAQARASIPDAMRGPDGSGAPFGPAVDVADSAPAADQLAGFLGRTP